MILESLGISWNFGSTWIFRYSLDILVYLDDLLDLWTAQIEPNRAESSQASRKRRVLIQAVEHFPWGLQCKRNQKKACKSRESSLTMDKHGQTWQTHTETIKTNTCRSVTVLGSRKQWGKAVSFTTSSSYEAKQDDLLRMHITPKTPKEECWRVVTWLFFIVFLCFRPWCSKMFAVITCAHIRRCHSQEHRKDAENRRKMQVLLWHLMCMPQLRSACSSASYWRQITVTPLLRASGCVTRPQDLHWFACLRLLMFASCS